MTRIEVFIAVSLLLFLGISCRIIQKKRTLHAKKRIHEIGRKRNLRDWDKGIKAFREMVVKDYLEGNVNSTAQPNGSAVTWLLTILQGSSPDSLSTWDELIKKKTKLITEKAEDPNTTKIKKAFESVMRIMEKSKSNKFAKSDQEAIRRGWQNFFPQAYSGVVYSVEWLNNLSKYLTMLAAGYIDLMKIGEYDECKLAEQLNMFKSHILELSKMFAKQRYQTLERVSWTGGRDEFKYTATLTFNDGVTGRVYKDIPLTQVQGRVLTPLRQQIADFIMKHLVFQYHALYNETWGSKSCSLENPITISDLELSYPDDCTDLDGICTLPCGTYSEASTWCVTKVKTNRWESTSREKYYDDCRLPDWNRCLLLEHLQTSDIKEEEEDIKVSDQAFYKPPSATIYPVLSINADNSNSVNNTTTTTENAVIDNPTTTVSETSSSIYNGVSAITTLLEDKMGSKTMLDEEEKKKVNAEITKKVENYVATDEKGGKKGDITRTYQQANGLFLDHSLSNIVEVLVVKAFLEKRRYGNIQSYLDGLEKWTIRKDFIKNMGGENSVLPDDSNKSTKSLLDT